MRGLPPRPQAGRPALPRPLRVAPGADAALPPRAGPGLHLLRQGGGVSPGERKARVLVVDDSTFVRKALRKVLEARPGLTVAGEAGDGREAVEMVASLQPDVVTLDIQMPGMDGLAALREIKARWPHVPVLVLASASSNGPEVVLEALSLGAFDFVDKARFRSMDFQLMGDEVVEKVRAGIPGGLPAPPPPRRRNLSRSPVPDGFFAARPGRTDGARGGSAAWRVAELRPRRRYAAPPRIRRTAGDRSGRPESGESGLCNWTGAPPLCRGSAPRLRDLLHPAGNRLAASLCRPD
ncbi:response regulator [Acidobacteria bacterium ACD]|nr:response regulator [Acidobacteria bacterium ACD]